MKAGRREPFARSVGSENIKRRPALERGFARPPRTRERRGPEPPPVLAKFPFDEAHFV
jgi:hypothetical protein